MVQGLFIDQDWFIDSVAMQLFHPGFAVQISRLLLPPVRSIGSRSHAPIQYSPLTILLRQSGPLPVLYLPKASSCSHSLSAAFHTSSKRCRKVWLFNTQCSILEESSSTSPSFRFAGEGSESPSLPSHSIISHSTVYLPLATRLSPWRRLI